MMDSTGLQVIRKQLLYLEWQQCKRKIINTSSGRVFASGTSF